MKSAATATFILVHGAWHGAWCWEKVQSLLEREGHTVVTPDLPGLGEDQTPIEACTLKSYVARITQVVDQVTGPVILLGHSLGGTTISQVAEQRPDTIALLIYLTALLPSDGISAMDQLGAALTPENELFRLIETDAQSMRLTEAALPFFYHDCAPEDLATARGHLRPQALAPMAAPLQLSARFARVPRAYITCTADRVLVPAMARDMAASCALVRTLPSGHSPFFACPDLLVKHLADLAHTLRSEQAA